MKNHTNKTVIFAALLSLGAGFGQSIMGMKPKRRKVESTELKISLENQSYNRNQMITKYDQMIEYSINFNEKLNPKPLTTPESPKTPTKIQSIFSAAITPTKNKFHKTSNYRPPFKTNIFVELRKTPSSNKAIFRKHSLVLTKRHNISSSNESILRKHGLILMKSHNIPLSNKSRLRKLGFVFIKKKIIK